MNDIHDLNNMEADKSNECEIVLEYDTLTICERYEIKLIVGVSVSSGLQVLSYKG